MSRTKVIKPKTTADVLAWAERNNAAMRQQVVTRGVKVGDQVYVFAGVGDEAAEKIDKLIKRVARTRERERS